LAKVIFKNKQLNLVLVKSKIFFKEKDYFNSKSLKNNSKN